jgi:hypothetical protein
VPCGKPYGTVTLALNGDPEQGQTLPKAAQAHRSSTMHTLAYPGRSVKQPIHHSTTTLWGGHRIGAGLRLRPRTSEAFCHSGAIRVLTARGSPGASAVCGGLHITPVLSVCNPGRTATEVAPYSSVGLPVGFSSECPVAAGIAATLRECEVQTPRHILTNHSVGRVHRDLSSEHFSSLLHSKASQSSGVLSQRGGQHGSEALQQH